MNNIWTDNYKQLAISDSNFFLKVEKNSLTTKNIPYSEASKLTELPPNTVLISINEPDNKEYVFPFDNGFNVLKVRMWDIRGEFRKDGKIYFTLDIKTAKEIVKFIELNKEKNYIIHCQAGISRSAAICMYINNIYGHSLKDNFFEVSHPNEYILGRLMVEKKKIDLQII